MLIELSKIKLKDVPKFHITGTFLVQVVKVYDGDTITIVLRTGEDQPWYEYSVRMHGYDTPELKPPKRKDYSESERFNSREEEVTAAKEARDYLAGIILEVPVCVKVIPDNDKYGRLLCKVFAYPKMRQWLDDINKTAPDLRDFNFCVNDDMIEKGYGYEYYGGTKEN